MAVNDARARVDELALQHPTVSSLPFSGALAIVVQLVARLVGLELDALEASAVTVVVMGVASGAWGLRFPRFEGDLLVPDESPSGEDADHSG